jgi:hypothetical protein
MPVINYNGEAWNYSFLSGVPGLNEEDRVKFITDSIILLKGNKEFIDTSGDNYEGRIHKRGHASIGYVRGRVIESELNTSMGKLGLVGLILQKVNTNLN